MDGRISNFMQAASIRRYEMTEGKERGLRVLDCDNGKLRFLLNESKALDVMQLYHEGQNVSFLSKNAFTSREIPFLGRFEGGMMYTCGLDSVGGREGFELHGSLHNTPARVILAECGEQGICIEAEIEDTALFGKNLFAPPTAAMHQQQNGTHAVLPAMRRKVQAEIERFLPDALIDNAFIAAVRGNFGRKIALCPGIRFMQNHAYFTAILFFTPYSVRSYSCHACRMKATSSASKGTPSLALK